MSAITKPTAAAGSGGLTLAQLQSEATNQGELDTSLSAISQAVATLGSQLQSAGAVPGELRLLSGSAPVPAGYSVFATNTPTQLMFNGSHTMLLGRRRLSSAESNATYISRPVRSAGVVWNIYNLTTGAGAYVEGYNTLTGETYGPFSYPLAIDAGTAACPAPAAAGGNLYFVGGSVGSSAVQSIYKMTTNGVFEAKTNLPATRTILSNGVTSGNYIYFFGGLQSGTRTASVVRYDWVNNVATVIAAALPQGPADSINAVGLNNGKILVSGGWSGSAYYATYAVFDPATESFGTLRTVPAGWSAAPYWPLSNTGAGVVGTANPGTGRAELVLFNESTEAWSTTGKVLPVSALVIGDAGCGDGSLWIPQTQNAGVPTAFSLRYYIQPTNPTLQYVMKA